MANGQPLVLGTFNTATLTTSLSATGITGSANQAALIAFGPKAGAGLVGRAQAMGPNLLSSEVGVAGDAQTTGVFGQSGGGMLVEDGNILIAATGVVGRSGSNGIGVHGASSAGIGVLGQDPSGVGVQGKSVSGPGVAGESQSAPGVSGRSPVQPGVRGESISSQGVYGKSASSAGVAGISGTFDGVFGRSTSGIGVHGLSANSIGVYGSGADEPGVRGDSNTDYGVFGASASGNGVHGWSTGSGAGAAGTSGYCAAGRGLHGRSVSGFGLYAESATGIAVLGIQNSSQLSAGHAVVGFSQTGYGVAAASAGQPSLYAVAMGNLAALFKGDVEVRGGFKVIGGPKSAVVPHRDGTHRQLYCVESPESWFEDFGEALVERGTCSVALDPDFAALVRSDGYQVFLTPYAAAALYVSKRSAKGFEIGAMPDANGAVPPSVACGYRIVARRRDIDAPRLAKVKVADMPALELPDPGKPRTEKAPKKVAAAMKEPKELAPAKVPPPPKALDKGMLTRRAAR